MSIMKAPLITTISIEMLELGNIEDRCVCLTSDSLRLQIYWQRVSLGGYPLHPQLKQLLGKLEESLVVDKEELHVFGVLRFAWI